MVKATMLLAAALLAVSAQAIQLRSDFCSGEACFEVLDRVHSTEACTRNDLGYKYMRCDQSSRSVFSVSCARGEGGCVLSYEDPASVLRASVEDADAGAQRDLFAIMSSTGTDKVTTHSYSPMYQKYLGPLSQNGTSPFTFLEVGFATGNSARAWAKFMPSADVHEMEISCDTWNIEYTAAGGASGTHRDLGYCRLHCGDAGSEDFLEESLQAVLQAPLIAVEDGGHLPAEIRDFFEHMWPRLMPGGMIFVEDLAESYATPNGWVETTVKPLMMDLIQADDPRVPARMPALSEDLVAMECREQICVFLKKAK